MVTSPEDASQIVDAILNRERPEADEDVYLGDLALHAAEFADDLEIFERFREDFPCVQRADGSTVPLDVSGLADTTVPFRIWPFLDRRSARTSGSGEKIVFVAPEVARASLRNGMVTFLTSRINSLRGRPDSRMERVQIILPNHHFLREISLKVSTSGFTVKVSATPGLRVHVSPTFRRAWRYFASPTSPATGSLPGGIYQFAVDGGPYPSLTPDSGVFDIPYTTTTPGLTL